MRRILLLVVFAGSLTTTQAQQFSNQVWHKGFLVTTDQDTIRGDIKYDMETNIVQLVKNKVVKTYSSHKVFYFEIYDKVVNNYRQFYSIPYNVNYNYEIPIIFEVLFEGPLSLLAREAVVQETVNNSMASPTLYGNTYVRDRMAYTFYFLDKKGNMSLYSGKKNDLYIIMVKKQRQVKQFIKDNRLSVDEVRDLIRITAFYNSI